MGFELTSFIGKVDEEFVCTICTMVLENPVQSSCEHIFCDQCINQWFAIENTCPVCRRTAVGELKPVARYFRNVLDKLEIKCDFESKGCQSVLQLQNLKDHISNHCLYNPDVEIICDKGCNIAVGRREYEADNCFTHLSNALKKLKVKHDEQTKIVNLYRWQMCYNVDISISEPNILKYGQWNAAGALALVQSIRPLAPDNTSFKIEIVDVGEDNIIAIGLTSKGYAINNQPGWLHGSIGYHGDDGKLFNGNGRGEEFGPIWKNGDVIECGVKQPVSQMYSLFRSAMTAEVYFSRNGRLIGMKQVKIPELGFFPTVSLRSRGSKVRYVDG